MSYNIVTQFNVIIYTLYKNLNTVSKDHVCVIFSSIKYIVSNYVINFLNISINKCFYVIFKSIRHKILMMSHLVS